MRIRLLGTGTPTPSLKRMSSGYLVETAQRKVLFDFGPGTYHRMLEAGVRAVDITDVFFTHLHYDHCLDYVRLLMTRWDQGAGRIPELNVYGPAYTARMTEAIIGENGLFAPDLAARTELRMSQDVYVARGGTLPRHKPKPVVREIRSGEVIDCDGFRVHARSVLHAQPFLECFGYRMEADGSSFAYSGDAGPLQGDGIAGARLRRPGAHVSLHQRHRAQPRNGQAQHGAPGAGATRPAAGVRNLVVSHVTEQMDVPGVRERLIREMSALYAGNLFFGEDLMEIPVGAPAPARLEMIKRSGMPSTTSMPTTMQATMLRVHRKNAVAANAATRCGLVKERFTAPS